jgi:hypothetical protein
MWKRPERRRKNLIRLGVADTAPEFTVNAVEGNRLRIF